ncbi:MAG: efflux RND transporter permease subunit [Chloroflexi bacterium]|nr:efflux RND transporter permease subunit [Chloroflexota bacterium]
MNIPQFSVRRPIAVTVISLIVILMGLISLSRLNIDLFPKIDFPMITVATIYPGAGPEEIENTLTKPLEEAFGTLEDLEQISSVSREGVSQISIEFKYGINLDNAAAKVREKIDTVRPTFPAEVESPSMSRVDPAMSPILTFALSGPQDLRTLRTLADDVVKKRLQQIGGVAAIKVEGGQEREIQVQVDPSRLNAYNITLEDLLLQLGAENQNIPGGRLESGNKELLIRTMGEYNTLQDIENTVIGHPEGGFPITVKDVATVSDTHKDVRSYTRSGGNPAILISIQKNADANTIRVADEVKKAAEALSAELPQGTTLSIAWDDSKYIKRSIDKVEEDAVLGAILAVISIFLFLGNIRSTLVIGLSIPMSIIFTFVLMYFNDMTINMITLMGLMLGIGRIVDDSIVVLENIYRFNEKGIKPDQAAVEGANEVFAPVIASTLTTISVFGPLIFIQGLMREFFKPMGLTVTFALLASAGVSLTLVPMLSAKFLSRKKIDVKESNGKISEAQKKIMGWLVTYYRRALRWSLHHRPAIIGISALSFVLGLIMIGIVGFEFMPKQDQSQMTISIETPVGTSLPQTDRVVRQVEELVGKIPELKDYSSAVGLAQQGSRLSSMQTSGTTLGEVNINLVPKAERKRSIFQVVDDVREKVKNIPGARITASVAQSGPGGSALEVVIKGNDLDTLDNLTDELVNKIRNIKGLKDIDTSSRKGNPEIQVNVNRQKASTYSKNLAGIASTVRAAFLGTSPTKFRATKIIGDKEVDLTVIFKKPYREKLEQLRNLLLPSDKPAKKYPLAEIADVSVGSGPTQITREDQVRNVTVSADIQGRKFSDVIKDVEKEMAKIQLPPGYSMRFAGSQKQMMEAFGQLGTVLVLAIILVFLLMSFQFESFHQSLTIMVAIPLEIFGVSLGLLLSGKPFSIFAFMGLIMLSGIVLSNAILLVNYINILQGRGMSREDAILEAGPVRLRPILMTAFVTVLALVPMAISQKEGSEMFNSLGISVIGGLITSTVLTLVVVPVVYTLLDDLIKKFNKNKGEQTDINVPGEY